MLVLVTGLSPNEKPVTAPVVAAAVVAVDAGAAVVAGAPKGLSIKARPPLAVVAVAVVVGAAEVAGAPKVKPVPAAVGAAMEVVAPKREETEAGAAWVMAEGAGVDEGFIPKANPPPWTAVVAAVVAGWGWAPRVRVTGALVPKPKPPPVATGVGAAVVTWTLAPPKLKPPNERPAAAVVAAGAGWVWVWIWV